MTFHHYSSSLAARAGMVPCPYYSKHYQLLLEHYDSVTFLKKKKSLRQMPAYMNTSKASTQRDSHRKKFLLINFIFYSINIFSKNKITRANACLNRLLKQKLPMRIPSKKNLVDLLRPSEARKSFGVKIDTEKTFSGSFSKFLE